MVARIEYLRLLRPYHIAGTMTIAVRTDGVLQWILPDHLGSTSTTANADGTLNSVIKYTAFGEIRATQGITTTKYRFTGQLAQAELGLDYYVSRWYDPLTGHFTQADTLVPEPGKASAFDRYAYVQNNPLRYNDPSGHLVLPPPSNGFIQSINSFVSGAFMQYTNDVLMGIPAEIFNVDLSTIDASGFQEGREFGRFVSDIQASAELGFSVVTLGPAIDSISITLGTGGACTAVTAGSCAAVAAPVVVGEVGLVIVSAAAAAHGGSMKARNSNNPIKESERKDIELVDDAYLKKKGINAHEVKKKNFSQMMKNWVIMIYIRIRKQANCLFIKREERAKVFQLENT